MGADYTLKSIAAVVIGGTSLLGGSGGVMGSIFGAYALRAISGLLLFAGVSPLAQPLFEGVVLMVAIGLGAIRILANRNRLELLSAQETARSDPSRPLIRGLDNSVLVALGAIVVVLLIGSYYLPAFLSPAYLVLQLRIAAFLGIVAAGQMVVILLGHIDLSIPWTMTVTAMTATTLAGMGDPWVGLAIPLALAVGMAIGLFNGFGVAYLRLPSMILTLGHERGAAGAGGDLHRGLRAADQGIPADAGSWARTAASPACRTSCGCGWPVRCCWSFCCGERRLAARSTRSAIANGPLIFRASQRRVS